MAKQQLDLVIKHRDRAIAEIRVVADPDDASTLRQHLLAVMKETRGECEPKIAEYSVDVHKAGYAQTLYTYRTVPGGK